MNGTRITTWDNTGPVSYTHLDVYKRQAYGGSLYARTQVKNVQLISMTLPDINAGYIQKQPRWRANGAKSSNQYVFRI